MRDASGTPAASRDGAADDASADADAPAGKADPTGAGASPEGAPPNPVDPAAALLANLLNSAAPGAAAGAAPPAVPALVAGDGASIPGGPDASVRDAAATGATAGSGPILDAAFLTASARAARGDVQPGAVPAGATLRDAPKVEVLNRAVHFKPVVANAAAPDPAAPAAAQAAKPRPVRAALPDLVAAAAAKAALKIQPQPEGGPADAAPPGPDMTDRTALEDIRAITGIAGAALESDGRTAPEDTSEPGSRDGTGASLPSAAFATIAAAIRDAVDQAADATSESRIPADPSVRSAPDGPLRTLRIQLRPEDLGTVTVELRLTNGQLETHLRASRPETAALLHRDTAILTDLLKQANYQGRGDRRAVPPERWERVLRRLPLAGAALLQRRRRPTGPGRREAAAGGAEPADRRQARWGANG